MIKKAEYKSMTPNDDLLYLDQYKGKNYKVPFSEDGMMSYVNRWNAKEITRAVPNDTVFYLELLYNCYSRGRSSVVLWFKSTNTRTQEYPITMAEFHNMLRFMEKGEIKGRFGLSKKGTAFSLKYIGPGK